MFADAEEVDAGLVGEHRLLDKVADHLRMRQQVAVRAGGDVAEGVETELEAGGHGQVRNWCSTPFCWRPRHLALASPPFKMRQITSHFDGTVKMRKP